MKKKWENASLFGFPVAGFFWHRTEIPSFLTFAGNLGKLGYSILTAFLGITFVWKIVKIIPEKITSKISYFGKYSAEMYILQFFFIRNYIGNSYVDSVISLLLSLICPIIIARIFENKKIPSIIRIIIFGKN